MTSPETEFEIESMFPESYLRRADNVDPPTELKDCNWNLRSGDVD